MVLVRQSILFRVGVAEDGKDRSVVGALTPHLEASTMVTRAGIVHRVLDRVHRSEESAGVVAVVVLWVHSGVVAAGLAPRILDLGCVWEGEAIRNNRVVAWGWGRA